MIKYSKIILYLTIVSLIISFVYYKWNMFLSLKNISLMQFCTLFMLSCSHLFIIGLFFKKIVELFNLKLTFLEWFGLTCINSLYIYLLPFRGGLVVRAYYLKKKHLFPYSKYISLMTGSYLIFFLISSILAVTFSGHLLIKGHNQFFSLFIISCILFSGNLFFIILTWAFESNRINFSRINFGKKIDKIARNYLYGLTLFHKEYFSSLYLCFIHVLTIFLLALRLYLIFFFLNTNISFHEILLIQTLTYFSVIISITPGNLGIKEGWMAYLLTTVGIGIEKGLMVVIIDRVFMVLVVVLLGTIFSLFFLRNNL